MALHLSSNPSLLLRNPRNLRLHSLPSPTSFLAVSSNPKNRFQNRNRLLTFRVPKASCSSDEEASSNDPIIGQKFQTPETEDGPKISARITDEWGEELGVEEEIEISAAANSEADFPNNEDEWGADAETRDYLSGNGSAGAHDKAEDAYDKNGDLKRCLVDSFYGTEIGFRANAETRAEIVELINQLEAVNPTQAPTEATGLLDGNWILLYTAFSELLPLLAVGTLPLVKLKKISQDIDTASCTIKNSATFSSPFATFSFSASASFEVRSPSRIQVQFKEGSFEPPEISPSINLPENVDVFGQRLDLLPVQRLLNPLQEVVANISRAISGQPPVKVSIPGERTQSWLVTTYLDNDLRISRGDGGLFVLVKEGSPLGDGQ